MLSSTEEMFNNAADSYNRALQYSNYAGNIEFSEGINLDAGEATRNKKRTRNILWFNPPFSKSVKSNIGRTFLKLLSKHFPNGHRYHKLFNKYNVKVSYGCMKNVGAIIRSHNSRVSSKVVTATADCNCRRKAHCPLNGKCLSKSVVYKATVTSGDNSKSYIGLSGGTFKERYNNHTKSFRHEKYSKETELSKCVWNLKRQELEYIVTWQIIKTSNTRKRQSGQCNLCIPVDEKITILKSLDIHLLNRRTEFNVISVKVSSQE